MKVLKSSLEGDGNGRPKAAVLLGCARQGAPRQAQKLSQAVEPEAGVSVAPNREVATMA